MRDFILSFFALLFFSTVMFGQEIKGTVVDEEGKVVADVIVLAQKSNATTLSNLDGTFSIKAEIGETLKFSMIGFDSFSTKATSAPMMVHLFKSSDTNLQEVVVVGYGTQKKTDITGSVAVVGKEELVNRPNANPVSSLQGKVAGVTVVNSGKPGAAPSVAIRGIGSIGGNAVLYVVDGVLTDNISYINPTDIESMSILKDASSAAIYGIRAANGVIVIKTKLGKKGAKEDIKVDFDSNMGIQTPTNVVKMANAADYVQLYNESMDFQGASEHISLGEFNGADTNWYNEILKKSSVTQTHNVSLNGASEKTRYSMGIGYFTQDGLTKAGQGINSGDDYSRVTARFNGVYDITDKIRVGTNIVYYKFDSNDIEAPFQQARIAPSVMPVWNNDGSYGTVDGLGNFGNPRATLDFFRGKTKGTRTIMSGFFEGDILSNLTYKLSYSRDFSSINNYEYRPKYHVSGSQQRLNSRLTNKNDTFENLLMEQTLTWTKEFGEHRVVVLGGFSREEREGKTLRASAENVPFNGDDSTLFLNLGTPVGDRIDDYAEGSRTRYQSLFGRIQYAYMDKYLLNATVRRDGSSVYNFDGNQKSAIFPSIGAGWIISKENFMAENTTISFLKIKGSWGQLGNASIPRQFDSAASSRPGGFFGNPSEMGQANSITQMIDPSINWEVITEFDLGLEVKVLEDRLGFEGGYYHRTTNDAVFNIFIPTIAGLGTRYMTNAGSFVNKGFEFVINWNDRIGERFTYSIGANLTTIDNEITSVKNNSFLNTGLGLFGNEIKRWEKGQKIGAYYGYQTDGVIQTAEEATQWNSKVGALKFADLSGDGIIDERDKTFLGSPIPTFTYGLSINLGYDNVDFGVDLQGVGGNQIYNFNRNARFGNENWDQDFVNNRWTVSNPTNAYPAPNSDQNSSRPSSFYVEKGDYFRIRNVHLGYSFNKDLLNRIKVDKVRIYVSAQNPLTVFKYTGFSPELGNQTIEDAGIDNNAYPLAAIYSFGINFNF